jgi:hypothetical protein
VKGKCGQQGYWGLGLSPRMCPQRASLPTSTNSPPQLKQGLYGYARPALGGRAAAAPREGGQAQFGRGSPVPEHQGPLTAGGLGGGDGGDRGGGG